jgi:hypothetical protein
VPHSQTRGYFIASPMRRVLILVDQSAEPVVSSDVVDRGWGAAGEGP